jgi:hypothetical protein
MRKLRFVKAQRRIEGWRLVEVGFIDGKVPAEMPHAGRMSVSPVQNKSSSVQPYIWSYSSWS